MIALQPAHLVLTVVAGESRSRERRLAWGVAAPPLSLGADAEWQVRGAGIADIHVHLSFDGRRIRAAVASPAVVARVHDAPLGTEWRKLELPFELAFGSARVAGHVVGGAPARASVGARKGVEPSSDATRDAALEGRQETGFLDVQTINPAALIPRATLSVGVMPPSLATLPASERAEAERRGYSRTFPASAFQVASGSTLAWSLGSLRVPPPRPVRVLPGPPPARGARASSASLRASRDTLCDGGALRRYAQTLESRVAGPARPMSAPSDTRAHAGSAHAHAGSAHALAVALERLWRRASGLTSVPCGRRRVAMSAAAALLLTGWAALSAPASTEDRDGAAPMDLPGARVARSDAGSWDGAASAHTDDSPPNSPTRIAPAGEAPSLAMTPLDTARHSSVRSAQTAGDVLELAAFRAAFAGDIAEAEALYGELARQRSAPVFEHAARALREGRVHKP